MPYISALQNDIYENFQKRIFKKHICLYRGLPLITYAPRGRGGGQASYTFLLSISCKKKKKGAGGGGLKASKNAYVINGRPLKWNFGDSSSREKIYHCEMSLNPNHQGNPKLLSLIVSRNPS